MRLVPSTKPRYIALLHHLIKIKSRYPVTFIQNANIMAGTMETMPMQEPATRAPVALERMRPVSQTVECPHCGQVVKTTVEGRGKGMQRFMDVMFWPLRGRRNWWETTTWRCGDCAAALATQKNGKEIKVTK